LTLPAILQTALAGVSNIFYTAQMRNEVGQSGMKPSADDSFFLFFRLICDGDDGSNRRDVFAPHFRVAQ
jgi:hypothetical protein